MNEWMNEWMNEGMNEWMIGATFIDLGKAHDNTDRDMPRFTANTE